MAGQEDHDHFLDANSSDSSSLDDDASNSDDEDREMQIAMNEGLVDAIPGTSSSRKRPAINNPDALKAKTASFAKNLGWIETLDVTIPNDHFSPSAIDNDFERELIFYKQAEKAVQIALPRLEKLGVPITRPEDYYAEMAKSDEHMKKIRARLLEVQQRTHRADAIRRIRDEKKFAGRVQKEAVASKQSEKRQLNEAVKKHRKGMKAQLEQMLSNARGMHEQDEQDNPGQFNRAQMNRTFPKKGLHKGHARQARDKKFGFGGQKKRAKKNDAKSFNEMDFPGRVGKKKQGGGGRRKKKVGGRRRK